MTNIYWLSAINGSFANPSDWSGGTVPGALDDATLNAAGPDYTVTSARMETVESVQLASNATLNITAHRFTAIDGTGAGANAGTIGVYGDATLAIGGDVDNSGVILLDNADGSKTNTTTLMIASDTTLSGSGAINLSDSHYNDIIGNGVSLTNIDNVISGSGFLSSTKKGLTLINEAAGTISTSGGSELLIGPLSGAHGTVTNDGLAEATGTSDLIFDLVTVNGAAGRIVASDGAEVEFVRCMVIGQSFSIQAGSQILITNSSSINIDSSVTIAGKLFIDGGNNSVSIDFNLVNTGEIQDHEGSLKVTSAVTGTGFADIDRGVMEFDASFSQNVDFQSKNGAGSLVLGQSRGYRGVITNFSRDGKGELDLRDIGFVSAGEATFTGNASSGTLTVTNGTHTAHIKLQGDYLSTHFTASSDGLGGTIVVGSPDAAPAPPPHAFIAAMASFGGSTGHAIHTAPPTPARETQLTSPRARIA